MLGTILQYVVFGALLAVGLLIGWLISKHFKTQKKIQHYLAQGVYSPPGYDTFVLGHAPVYAKHQGMVASVAGTDKPALPHPLTWLLDQFTESKKDDSFDYTKNTVTVMSMMDPMVFVSDPEVVHDMVVTKNATIDKDPVFYKAISPFMGEAFIFARSDDKWKAKRKGISHTFFKAKLQVMLELLKKYTLEQQEIWLKECRASPDGSTKMDMSREILHILQRFLMHIVFGTNIDSTRLMIQVKEKPTEEFKLKSLNLSDANESCWV